DKPVHDAYQALHIQGIYMSPKTLEAHPEAKRLSGQAVALQHALQLEHLAMSRLVTCPCVSLAELQIHTARHHQVHLLPATAQWGLLRVTVPRRGHLTDIKHLRVTQIDLRIILNNPQRSQRGWTPHEPP